MGVLLSELGRKLAERWLSLLVLPGAFYLAVAVAARVLGHRHALDVKTLTAQVSAWISSPAATSTYGQAILLAAVIAGAAGIGLAAQALGSAVERVVLAPGWRTWPWPARRLAARHVTRRRAAWDAAHARYHQLYEQAARARATGTRQDPAERHAAHHRRTRVALERPDRPTWSGDRIHAVTVRLDRDLNLDLTTVWPYLWLTLPDTTRTEITTADQAVSRATTLTAWALLYLPLAYLWWPAAPAAAALAVTARRRVRAATDTHARLIEAATRLHLTDLADRLRIEHAGTSSAALGATITHHLQTSPPPPAPAPRAEARPPAPRPLEVD
jgi:hypothetical protein